MHRGIWQVVQNHQRGTSSLLRIFFLHQGRPEDGYNLTYRQLFSSEELFFLFALEVYNSKNRWTAAVDKINVRLANY